jgi:hypothetical protein
MVCNRQFQNSSNKNRRESIIWKEYVYQRQTISHLSAKHKKSKDWIRKRIKNASINKYPCTPQPVVVIADVTFFGRSSGLCVIRAPHLKKNLYIQEVQSESAEIYRQARIALENEGYTIKAIVLDGRPGVRQIFSDIPVQMCHFHQKQIITRYLTSNPKLQASRELKMLTKDLCKISEESFVAALDTWYTQWSSFLKERTTDPIEGKWHYTHKRLRSAHRSLRLNLPYLFTYQKYPELNIPNTTNSLDGCFAYLKELLRVHRGSTRRLKNKIIEDVLGR